MQVKVPWAEPHGRFTLLMERFVIDVLQACQTVKGACTLVGISWDQARHVLERAVARGLAHKQATAIACIGVDEKAFRVRPPQPLLTAGIASRIDLDQPVFEEAFHGKAVESVEGDRVAEAAAAV